MQSKKILENFELQIRYTEIEKRKQKSITY